MGVIIITPDAKFLIWYYKYCVAQFLPVETESKGIFYD